MRPLIIAALLALVGTSGCASAGSGSSSGGSRNHIVQEELQDPPLQSMSVFEAIQRLRPRWLRSRASGSGGTQTLPAVFLNGSRYGNIGSLQSMRVNDVEDIRFINSRDATTRYGTGFPGGIISVNTKR